MGTSTGNRLWGRDGNDELNGAGDNDQLFGDIGAAEAGGVAHRISVIEGLAEPVPLGVGAGVADRPGLLLEPRQLTHLTD